MQEKLYQGYSLHMDKFYNNFTLAKQLLSFNTYCTGTLHAGRRYIPEDVAKAKLNIGESISRYAEGVFIGKWRDRRDVLYISTEHDNEMVKDRNYKRDTKKKPKPIVEFQKYIPGIDLQEQMMSYYPFSRKTIGWYKKLGFHVIHMMVFNAFLLYIKYSGKKMPFYDFRLSIVEDLLPADHALSTAPKKPPKLTLLEHFPTKCLKNEQGRAMRRRCKSCWSKNIRKDTQYLCTTCPGSPGLCLEPCFKEYHAHVKLK
ncbi:hypothetical protein NQ314_012132 [Rhamnusium bicolor]|uniref:PiggyBac transposable element-derived protein domain-containing protein n=1 Tax=Rhamnusium bicolor TaxID=1586634 RepID=A0AAV8XEM1_9CUCU|nr:hypothetical protein NQ314_012132 [Rhamnusium bicolor]